MKTVQPEADPINHPHNRGTWLDDNKVFGCSSLYLRKAAEYIAVPFESLKLFSPKEVRGLVDEAKAQDRNKAGEQEKAKLHLGRRGSEGGIKLPNLRPQPKAHPATITTSPTQSKNEKKILGVTYWLEILARRIYQLPIRAADGYLLRKEGETQQTLKEYSRFGLGDLVEEAYEKSYIQMRLSQEQLDDLFKKVQGRIRNPLMKAPRGKREPQRHWESEKELWQDEHPEWKVPRIVPGVGTSTAVA